MRKLFKPSILLLTLSSMVMFSSCQKDCDCPNPNGPSDESVLVENYFDQNAEGWTIFGDAQDDIVDPSYLASGGVNGGYIYAIDDVAGGVWFFRAPSAYTGNKASFYGADLSYYVFQDSNMDYQFEYYDVAFISGDKMIFQVMDESKYPKDTWTKYSFKIEENKGWMYVDDKDYYSYGEPATKAQMQAVLSNVTDFMIRGEYETGDDLGGLDEVVIRK